MVRGRGLLQYPLRTILAVTWEAAVRLPVNAGEDPIVGWFAACECLLSCGHSVPGTHHGRLRARCRTCGAS